MSSAVAMEGLNPLSAADMLLGKRKREEDIADANSSTVGAKRHRTEEDCLFSASRFGQVLCCAAQAGYSEDIFAAASVCKTVYDDASLWGMLSRFRSKALVAEHSKGPEAQGRLFHSYRTPLMAAAKFGNASRVRWLLDCFPATSTAASSTSSSSSSSSSHSFTQAARMIDSADMHGKTALHYAAHNSRPEILKLLLVKGKADPNKRDMHRQTPLHASCARGDFRCTALLLCNWREDARRGAFPNLRDHRDRRPWDLVPEAQRACLYTLLLRHGARPTDPIEAFKLACGDKEHGLADVLIQRGHIDAAGTIRSFESEYRQYDADDEEVLRRRLKRRQQEKKKKKEKKKKPEEKHENNEAAEEAKENKDNTEADEDSDDDDSDSEPLLPSHRPLPSEWPLLIAINEGRPDIAVKLLEPENADPDIGSTESAGSPLLAATRSGMFAVVEKLLQRGADLTAHDGFEGDALRIACSHGYVDIARLLIQHGADVNAPAMRFYSNALYASLSHKSHAATQHRPASTEEDYDQLFQLLIDSGADLQGPRPGGKEGTSLVRAAVAAGRKAALVSLLDKGAQLDPQVLLSTFFSPDLRDAHAQIVLLLLDRGLDPLACKGEHFDKEERFYFPTPTQGYRCPLILACSQATADADKGQGTVSLVLTVIARLLAAGVKPQPEDAKEGVDYSLQIAAKAGNESLVALLLDHGAPIDHRGEKGKTALWQALIGGHISLVTLLLAKGADPNIKDSDKQSLLQYGSDKAEVSMVRALIEGAQAAGRCLEIDYRCEDTRDSLHYSASAAIRFSPLGIAVWGCRSNKECAKERGGALMKLLLDHGADPSQASTGYYYSAFETAIKCGLVDAALHLMRDSLEASATAALAASSELEDTSGATSESSDHSGLRFSDAVELALRSGQNALASSLIAMVQPDSTLSRAVAIRECAFEIACEKGAAPVARALVDLGLKLAVHSKQTALRKAAHEGNSEAVRFLLTLGVDADTKDQLGRTALMTAVHGGHVEVIKLLLVEGKADPNACSSVGETPLLFGLQGRQAAAIETLLSTTIDIAAGIATGCKKLDITRPVLVPPDTRSCSEGATAAIGPVDKEKNDSGDRNDKEWSPFGSVWPSMHFAVWKGLPTVVSALIDAGVHVDIRDHTGCTALHIAAALGHQRAITALLARGANLNARNGAEETPLLLAASRGHLECCKVLVAAGSDLSARDVRKRTALLRAALDGAEPVSIYLASLLAQLDLMATDDRGNSAFNYACRRDFGGLALTLMHKGAATRAETLKFACKHRESRLILKLLDDSDTAAAREAVITQEDVSSALETLLRGPSPKLSAELGNVVIRLIDASGTVAPKYSVAWAVSLGSQNLALRILQRSAGYAAHQDALQQAVGKGMTRLVLQLLSKGISGKVLNPLLEAACSSNAVSMVMRLLEVGATPSQEALLNACDIGNPSILRALLKYKSQLDLNSKGPRGKDALPLQAALAKGHAEAALILLDSAKGGDDDAGAGDEPVARNPLDVNAKFDDKKRTALLLACKAGLSAVVKRLVASGAVLEHEDSYQYDTPVSLCVEHGHLRCLLHLLQGGADPSYVAQRSWNSFGRAPLLKLALACKYRAHPRATSNLPRCRLLAMADALSRFRANPNGQHDDVTPLAPAVQARDYNLALRLVCDGANVNATVSSVGTQDKASLLETAVAARDVLMIRLLVGFGADPLKVGLYGITPLEKARQERDRSLSRRDEPVGVLNTIVEILEEAAQKAGEPCGSSVTDTDSEAE